MPTPGPAPSKHCSASLACLRPGLAGSAAACARCFPPRRRRARRSSYWGCRIFLPAASHWASRRWPSRTGCGWRRRSLPRWRSRRNFGSCPVGMRCRRRRCTACGSTPAWPLAPAPTPARACACAGSPARARPKASHWAGGERVGGVLDYGCGSGILALAAAKFGARDVDAVDIDPAAVQATARNAQANAVQLHAGLPEQARGEYQTVLANILATPLRVLAPLLCGHLAPGGRLVLAGILERQAQALKQAYAPWLALTVTDAEDGWILMTACRH